MNKSVSIDYSKNKFNKAYKKLAVLRHFAYNSHREYYASATSSLVVSVSYISICLDYKKYYPIYENIKSIYSIYCT